MEQTGFKATQFNVDEVKYFPGIPYKGQGGES